MKCPECKGFEAMCTDSRDRDQGRRRRYACPCGAKFTTVELHVAIPPGRPGMKRRGSNAFNVLRSRLEKEADQRAKARLRAFLE